MKLTNVISTKQFLDTGILDEIFDLAHDMKQKDSTNQVNQTLSSKIIATVFYESSTRTRFSFEAAMLKLGGKVISTESASHFSSVSKGESLQDTVQTISGYADAIILRHPKIGSAKIASQISKVPVINAGDGAGEHPTQSLLDMFTIREELGAKSIKDLKGLNVAMVGDLLNGRTIHSLLMLLSLVPDLNVYLVAPWQLRLQDIYVNHLSKQGITFHESDNLDDILPHIDIVYMTRIQKERFDNEDEYKRLKGSYILDKHSLDIMPKKSIIMHPLPRVDEINPNVDNDPRAAYFRQAKNGMYTRMSLLQMILGQ